MMLFIKKPKNLIWAIMLLIPLSIYFRFELTKNWELLFFVVGFLLILLLQFARRDNKNAIVGLSTTLFGVLYVAWFFSFLVKIRFLLPGIEGVKLLGFLLLVQLELVLGYLLLVQLELRYLLLIQLVHQTKLFPMCPACQWKVVFPLAIQRPIHS